MVRYWAHNPGTDKACLGSTPSPASMKTNLAIIINMIARFFILCLIVNIVIKNLNLKNNVVYIKDYVNLDPIMKNKLKNDVMAQELHQNIILENN